MDFKHFAWRRLELKRLRFLNKNYPIIKLLYVATNAEFQIYLIQYFVVPQ